MEPSFFQSSKQEGRIFGRRKRKRCQRTSMNRKANNAPSSWTPLLWMFVVAAVITRTSTVSYVVEGQPTTQNPESVHEPSSLLRAASATSTGTIRKTANHNQHAETQHRNNRAFIRQQQQDQDPTKGMEAEERTRGYAEYFADDDEYLFDDDDFLDWCQDVLGIDTSLVEIDYFEYPDYIRAMNDRIDIFCENCDQDDDETSFQSESSHQTYARSLLDRERRSHYSDIHTLTDPKSAWEAYPPLSVRGLKASKFISKGNVILSIPHGALWTIHNVIDNSGDSQLIAAMGPEARRKHGWQSPGMDEIPLLAVAVLYHKQKQKQMKNNGEMLNALQGVVNHKPYLEMIWNMGNGEDHLSFQDDDTLDFHHLKEQRIPHLWPASKLQSSATESIRRVAEGIRQDVLELYESIVLTLVEGHPETFGPTKGTSNDTQDTPVIDDSDDEWMFSLEKFHWAFALVNSRHWHLQIPDVPKSGKEMINPHVQEPDSPVATPGTSSGNIDASLKFPSDDKESADTPVIVGDDHDSFTDQEGPPAATPTDEWVVIQDQKLREEEEREMIEADDPTKTNTDDIGMGKDRAQEYGSEETNDEEELWPPGNSFLAPLADLLNFGPPCTRGFYNEERNAFEIVATCDFQEGQEITFWYTDECEDVFVANYGFTMPMMVPKCDDVDARSASKQDLINSMEQEEYLENELFHAYDELDRMNRHVDVLLRIIDECHCENQTDIVAGSGGNNGKGGNSKSVSPLPRSPSPPIKEESGLPNNWNEKDSAQPFIAAPTKRKEIRNQNNAQHAIRNRKTNNSSGNENRSQGSMNGQTDEGSNSGIAHQRHHRRHSHANTRTRSRSYQGRQNEF